MISLEGGHVAVGITAGALTAIPALLLLEVISPGLPASEAVYGAIIGGLIAGTVAFLSQLLVILDNLRRQRDAASFRDQAIAASIFLKVSDIYDVCSKANNYYRTFDHRMMVVDGEPKCKNPFLFGKGEVVFSSQEKAYLIRVRELDAFNKLNDLESFYSNFQILNAGYVSRFEEFTSRQRQSGNVSVNGSTIGVMGRPDPAGLLEIRAIYVQITNLLIEGRELWMECGEIAARILETQSGTRLKREVNNDIPGAADLLQGYV